MFTSQRNSRTVLLLVLATPFFFLTKAQTASTIGTTAASNVTSYNVTNSTLNLINSTLSSPTEMEMKSRGLCGSDMIDFCANGGQCVYHPNQGKHSCKCTPPFEGERCMVMTSLRSKNDQSKPLIGVIVGVTTVIFVLVIIVLCCFHKRCVKSAPVKSSAPKVQV